jgi:hypothetical protein
MSEKKPFDAAINYLTVMADRDFANGAPHRGSCRAAIRVLVAAGKLNSGDRTWLRWVVTEGISSSERGRKDRFRALLEALPEKEEKK